MKMLMFGVPFFLASLSLAAWSSIERVEKLEARVKTIQTELAFTKSQVKRLHSILSTETQNYTAGEALETLIEFKRRLEECGCE